MTTDKNYKDESQDARRRDQHNATHPGEKSNHNSPKSDHKQKNHTDEKHNPSK